MNTLDVRKDNEITAIKYNDFHVITNGDAEQGDSSFVNVCREGEVFMYRVSKADIDNYIEALKKAKELWG